MHMPYIVGQEYARRLPIAFVESEHMSAARHFRNVLLGGLQQNSYVNIELHDSMENFLIASERSIVKPICVFVEYGNHDEYVLGLIREIRENKTSLSPFVHVCAIAEIIEAGALQTVLLAGINDVITVPIRFGTLAERIRRSAGQAVPFALSRTYVGPYGKMVRNEAKDPAYILTPESEYAYFIKNGQNLVPDDQLIHAVNSAVCMNEAGIDLLQISKHVDLLLSLAENIAYTPEIFEVFFEKVNDLRAEIEKAVKNAEKRGLVRVTDILNSATLILERFNAEVNICYQYKEIQVLYVLSRALRLLYADGGARDGQTRDVLLTLENRYLKDNIFCNFDEWRRRPATTLAGSVSRPSTSGKGSSLSPNAPADGPARVPPKVVLWNPRFRESFAPCQQDPSPNRRIGLFFAGMVVSQLFAYRDTAQGAPPISQAAVHEQLAVLFREDLGRALAKSRYIRFWADSALRDGFKPLGLMQDLCGGDTVAISQAVAMNLEACGPRGELRRSVTAMKDQIPDLYPHLDGPFINAVLALLFADPMLPRDIEKRLGESLGRLQAKEIKYSGFVNTVEKTLALLPAAGREILTRKILRNVLGDHQMRTVLQCLGAGGGACPVLACADRRLIPSTCPAAAQLAVA